MLPISIQSPTSHPIQTTNSEGATEYLAVSSNANIQQFLQRRGKNGRPQNGFLHLNALGVCQQEQRLLSSIRDHRPICRLESQALLCKVGGPQMVTLLFPLRPKPTAYPQSTTHTHTPIPIHDLLVALYPRERMIARGRIPKSRKMGRLGEPANA